MAEKKELSPGGMLTAKRIIEQNVCLVCGEEFDGIKKLFIAGINVDKKQNMKETIYDTVTLLCYNKPYFNYLY